MFGYKYFRSLSSAHSIAHSIARKTIWDFPVPALPVIRKNFFQLMGANGHGGEEVVCGS